MLRAIGRSGGDALRRALLASAPTAQPSARGAQPFALRGLATAGAAGAGGWWARSCAVATEHLEGWRTAAAGWAPSAARSIATSTAASMAKPGNIKEHALLKDWMFEEMGIAKPGSEPKRRRSGAIAVKCGMTAEWNEHGVRVPLTVLWIDDCRVRPDADAAGGIRRARRRTPRAPPPARSVNPRTRHPILFCLCRSRLTAPNRITHHRPRR